MNEAAVVGYRSVVAFLTLFIYSRVLGKQQIGQLSFFEYVTGITIGSVAASMSVDLTSPTLPHWVGLSVWFLLTLTFQVLALKSDRLGKLLTGSPVTIIQNGQLLETNMATIRYPLQDLLVQLRSKGVFDLGQVENAVLEPNGSLSVQLKSQHRPLTPGDLGIPTPYEGFSQEVIREGQMDIEKMSRYSIRPEWILAQLRAHGIDDVQSVFLAVLNTKGELYVAPYHDQGVREDTAQNKEETKS